MPPKDVVKVWSTLGNKPFLNLNKKIEIFSFIFTIKSSPAPQQFKKTLKNIFLKVLKFKKSISIKGREGEMDCKLNWSSKF